MESLLFALTFLAALGAGLIGGLFFAFSSFVMTALHRLPSATGISAMLNNELARVKPESAEGASLWKQYLAAWTAWKHVRTVAALAGAACFTMALVRWPS
jgi:uncharacterized membrane protein